MKKIALAAFFLLTMVAGWAQKPERQARAHQRDAMVKVETNYGVFVVRLYGDTPLHTRNFLDLVKKQAYDGLLFHRVIDRFMVQAGDPKSREAKPGDMLGDGTLGYTIPAEIRKNHLHKRGALCAARQGDDVNPFRESSASQFYIVLGDKMEPRALDEMEKRMGRRLLPEQRKLYSEMPGTPHLDGDYTVFGEVVEGMEVIEKIGHAKTDPNDRPLEDIRILHMEVLK